MCFGRTYAFTFRAEKKYKQANSKKQAVSIIRLAVKAKQIISKNQKSGFFIAEGQRKFVEKNRLISLSLC
jgi:hypothetical protein